MTKKQDLGATVDKLGEIKAKIAQLKKQAGPLEDALWASNKHSIEGKLFRAVMSSYDRDTLDLEAAKAKLGARWVNAHTTRTQINKLDVKARNNRE